MGGALHLPGLWEVETRPHSDFGQPSHHLPHLPATLKDKESRGPVRKEDLQSLTLVEVAPGENGGNVRQRFSVIQIAITFLWRIVVHGLLEYTKHY